MGEDPLYISIELTTRRIAHYSPIGYCTDGSADVSYERAMAQVAFIVLAQAPLICTVNLKLAIFYHVPSFTQWSEAQRM